MLKAEELLGHFSQNNRKENDFKTYPMCPLLQMNIKRKSCQKGGGG